MMLLLTAYSSTPQEAACLEGVDVEVMTTEAGVEFVRTPDACFENLPDWPYEPHSQKPQNPGTPGKDRGR